MMLLCCCVACGRIRGVASLQYCKSENNAVDVSGHTPKYNIDVAFTNFAPKSPLRTLCEATKLNDEMHPANVTLLYPSGSAPARPHSLPINLRMFATRVRAEHDEASALLATFPREAESDRLKRAMDGRWSILNVAYTTTHTHTPNGASFHSA